MQTLKKKPLPVLRREEPAAARPEVQEGLLLGTDIPYVVRSLNPEADLMPFVRAGRERLLDLMARHGALLFRGFDPIGATELHRIMTALTGPPLEYSERSSPRSDVGNEIYTSTDYPPEYAIYLHNEQSYNAHFPRYICFSCVVSAEEQGETPIADSRRVYARIDPGLRERLERQGYLYVRNFGKNFGLPWQEAFSTRDPAEVERYCAANDIELEWVGDDHLRTRQRRPVSLLHPVTGAPTWFNHATFFHVSTLPEKIGAFITGNFSPENYPNNTYWGDGTPFTEGEMAELRAAYAAQETAHPWQVGDILFLENTLVGHGRRPFKGPRKILVGMSEKHHWSAVARPGG